LKAIVDFLLKIYNEHGAMGLILLFIAIVMILIAWHLDTIVPAISG
jgi:hypothetical protein